MAWTDERLDDLSHRMDEGFARVDADIRDLRVEVREMGAELRNELRGGIGGLRNELRAETGSLRGEIDALRVTLIRVGGGIMAGLVGVIAAVLLGS